MGKNCPPVEVDMSAIVKQVKQEVLASAKPAKAVKAGEESVNAMKLVPSGSDFKGGQFVLGYVTIPSIVNLGTKMADEGVLFPQIDMAVSRVASTGVTLVAHLLTGGKSFLLGALIGQIPTTTDALAEKLVDHLKSRQMQGRMGATDDEVRRLRHELEQMNGISSRRPSMAMAGAAPGSRGDTKFRF